MELHALKDQMQNVRNADGDIKRFGLYIFNYMLFCVFMASMS